jgi:hypothetical protein
MLGGAGVRIPHPLKWGGIRGLNGKLERLCVVQQSTCSADEPSDSGIDFFDSARFERGDAAVAWLSV